MTVSSSACVISADETWVTPFTLLISLLWEQKDERERNRFVSSQDLVIIKVNFKGCMQITLAAHDATVNVISAG